MTRVIDDFLSGETSAGFVLIAAAVFALAVVNSPLEPYYNGFLNTPVELRIGAFEIAKSLLLWINDGLMAVFFFVIGLEVKRELIQGELSSFHKAGLPIIAAVGGMLVPALVFVIINRQDTANLSGWAIPAATDIAFALGVLALLGTRIPPALKVFLLAVAIIDDIGAVVIIALFYTADISELALVFAAFGIIVLFALNRFGVERIAPYVLAGIFLWVCVLESGVHATLAGAAAALSIPLRDRNGDAKADSPLRRLEHGLHPWVAFAVLPLFAFANAGVSFSGMRMTDMLAPLPFGIALGLFFGKQFGVFTFMVLAVRVGLARIPNGVSWGQLWGVSCLTGIGFTMSLFIGSLAFNTAAQMDQVKIGVLLGSLTAGLLGFVILRFVAPHPSSDTL